MPVRAIMRRPLGSCIDDSELGKRQRRRTTGIAGALLCAVLASGCDSNPAGPGTPLGLSFDLTPGSSATLTNGLKVTFNAVTADSRCPIGVFCVSAGDATVVVTLSQQSAAGVLRELHTNLNSATEVRYATSVVKLIALAPVRRADFPIGAKDYVATFQVDNPEP